MYLTFLFCSVCCSEFGSLLWGDEVKSVKSPTRLAPSLAGGFHPRGNVSFAISHARVSFQKGRIFFFSPPGELDLRLSCVNLAPFKVSILNKRTVFLPVFASIHYERAYISGGERLVFLCTTPQVCTARQQAVHTHTQEPIGRIAIFLWSSVFGCTYYLIFYVIYPKTMLYSPHIYTNKCYGWYTFHKHMGAYTFLSNPTTFIML